MTEIIRMLSYEFMQRAFVVGILVSLCAALLGVSLVLKRYSMIGDGLSHVGFGALAVASALGLAPLAVAVPAVVAAAVLLLRLRQNAKVKGDAAIAMISASALAIGVISVSVTTGMNTEVSSYMFGSILSLSRGDAVLSVLLSGAVLALFVLFCPRDGHKGGAFQYAYRRAHGGHGRARYAHDGCAADIEPCYLPGSLGDEILPELQGRCGLRRGIVRRLLCRGNYGVVFPRNADRRKHRCCRPYRIRAVGACRQTEKIKPSSAASGISSLNTAMHPKDRSFGCIVHNK